MLHIYQSTDVRRPVDSVPGLSYQDIKHLHTSGFTTGIPQETSVPSITVSELPGKNGCLPLISPFALDQSTENGYEEGG